MAQPSSLSAACGPSHRAAGVAVRPGAGQVWPRVGGWAGDEEALAQDWVGHLDPPVCHFRDAGWG